MLIYVIAGLTSGSVFGLAAVGVVLTYRTSGIFNFAHGAMASASAFIFYALNAEHGVPWPAAAVLSVLIGGPVMGIILEMVAARVASATVTIKVVATIGVLLTLQSIILLVYPPGPTREVAQFLPTSSFHLFGTPVEWYRAILMIIGVVGVSSIGLILNRTKLGVAMRAVVDDPVLLDVMGISPRRVRRAAWMLSATTASVAGVLLAPLLALDQTNITVLVVTAFGAAAIGRFSNLWLTFAGGLIIGISQSILDKYVSNAQSVLTGVPASLPFLVLFGILLIGPRSKAIPTGSLVARAPFSTWRAPARARLLMGAIVVLLLLFVPQLAGGHLVPWTRFLAYCIVFLSLGLLVRLSGQVSLAHVTFMAIGACVFADFTRLAHWSWAASAAIAVLIVIPVGVLLAIPAIRFPGVYLALATLGFSIAVQQMFYRQHYMFGINGFVQVRQPDLSWLGVDPAKAFYYLCLVIAVIVGVAVVGLTRTRLGRLLNALGDSTAGLGSSGASINVTRVLVFGLSAGLAALGGVLDGGALNFTGSAYYDPMLSLQLFAVILISLGGAPWYAVAAAAAQVVVPSYISASVTVGYALTGVFGVFALSFAMSPVMPGLPAAARAWIERVFGGRARTSSATEPLPQLSTSPSSSLTEPAPSRTVMRAEGITVRYGGLVAADGVNLRVKSGQIVALIGPNGAGKTTVLNACAGALKPNAGRVYLIDRFVDRLSAPRRARRGLGRTFQKMELFGSLSVRDNVALGLEGRFASFNPLGHLVTSRRQREEIRNRTAECLQLCFLTEIADLPVGDLSTGQRRLVELARALAGKSEVLLLDEPSSGLDERETEKFGRVLREVAERRGVGILLIEHDIALVSCISDYVFVVDFGKPLFDGSVEEALTSALVQAAYLGDPVDESMPTAVATPRIKLRPALATAPANEPILELVDVTAGYGDAIVLRDVSLTVHPGEVVALLGPNGAGKTTLLRTAAGIILPRYGKVVLAGDDITRKPAYERARAGLCLIPEGRGIFRSLTVRENLRVQRAGAATNDDLEERVFATFPVLGKRLGQAAGRLSGGEQQMLALGRAYVTNPDLILVDEVSMGLAPMLVEEMFSALSSLIDQGTSMILVEQYVSRALAVADHTLVLQKGRLVHADMGLDQEALVRTYLGV